MKQAIVHVGLHRCASTSIQIMLETLRPQIEASGTDLVLRKNMKASYWLNEFRSIQRHDSVGLKGWWRGTVGCAALARLPHERLLVSEEALYGTMPGHTDHQFYPRHEQLWTALARSHRLEVHPRIVVRRQDKWIESIYGFRVAHGLKVDFADFADGFDPAQIDYNILLSTLDRFNLLSRTRFGILEDWIKRGTLECAAELLDLPIDNNVPQMKRNRRQSPHALRILVALNRSAGSEIDQSQRASVNKAIRQLGPDCSLTEITPLLEAALPSELQHHIAKIVNSYDPEMPVKMTDDQRGTWRSAMKDKNREFLDHPTVNLAPAVWEDD